MVDSDWTKDINHRVITPGSEDFPELLARIADPPTELYVAGDVEALHLPAIAVVGSRNPTEGGRRNAYAFARHLSRAGFCIVSGLALGIDTAAHRGALDGGGKTIAVLGHGIDRIYPPQNEALAKEIVADGAVCTEFPPGYPPRRENFPRRNRLISGLALGTLVVEAAKRSGSLISARLAGEQGREIFAIPGSIHNPMARGCHQLIRQGAKLVESADDILSELAPLVRHLLELPDDVSPANEAPPQHDGDYAKLLSIIAFDPLSADEIATRSGLTIDQVSSMLLILELEGLIESQPGGRYSRLLK